MKKFIVGIGFLLAVGILAAQPGHGQREQKRNGNHHGQNSHGSIVDQLDLTEAQKSEFESLRLAHQKLTGQFKNELDIQQARLKAELQKDAPQTKSVTPLVEEINKTTGNLFSAHVEHMMKVRAILTPEQQVKFDRMHSEIGPGFGPNYAKRN